MRYLERPHQLGAWVEFPLTAQVAQSDDEEVVAPRAVAAADPLSGLLQMRVRHLCLGAHSFLDSGRLLAWHAICLLDSRVVLLATHSSHC
jgi:hypothetical protein